MESAASRARSHRAPLAIATFVAVIGASVWAFNYVRVTRPVDDALRADSRNERVQLRAHYAYYVDPRATVLDLKRAEDIAPVDLFRSLFEAAEALKDGSSERITLARNGRPVFVMKGEDFREMGNSFGSGENPVYLIRTLPEKLYKPSGARAFGSWEGGWLGVMTHQMDDANRASRQWALAENEP